MKTHLNVFLIITILFTLLNPKTANAQCGPTMVNATTLYYPDTIVNLPSAMNGNSYAGVLQLFVPASFSGVPITSVTVNSVNGLPATITYSTSPSNGTILANNSGCILLTSSQVNATIGLYPLTINVTASSPFGTFPQTITGYKIQVNNPSNPSTTFSSFNASICNGSNYTFNNHSLTVAGTYFDTLVNYLGADSIITLQLTVKPTSTKIFTNSICQGDTLLFNGNIYTSTGSYTQHLTNYLGCDSSVILNLTVNPKPSIPTISQSNCTLSCDSLAASYQWYYSGTIIPSATAQNYVMPSTGISGIFSVQITNAQGCSQFSAQDTFYCSIGINEMDNSDFINVSPSPFQGEITVNVNGQIKKGEISILNAMGQMQKTQSFENSSTLKMNLSDLANGVYYLQIKSAQHTQTKRLIKAQ